VGLGYCAWVQILSYGGGTNSAAVAIGLEAHRERPDLIIFADTGSEKPHTYEHLEIMQAWCLDVGFPPITVIKALQPQQQIDGSLHAECLRLGRMPSKAYGFAGCSVKWKLEPQQRYLRKWVAERGASMRDVVRLIGFDADEPQRVTRATASIAAQLAQGREDVTQQRYPLVEWGWGRDECVAAIASAGIPQPGKSSCFMCPSSRKPEILELRSKYPALLDLALQMESRALAGEGSGPASRNKGLGRNFAWGTFLSQSPAAQSSFCDTGAPEMDCGCYDGE